ncbi:MAG TPA: ATP-grasp domain-containing protein [bacterium]|nr:ATP-grasp domain-containing protein [bacterium]
MKILFLSPALDSIGIQIKLSKKHKILTIFCDKKEEHTGDNLIDRILIPKNEISFEKVYEVVKKFKPDFIIVDFTGLKSIPDQLREAGYRVWGGGSFCDVIEYDRYYVVNLLHTFGVNIPETYEFDNLREAVDFLVERGGRWVYKPEGSKEASHTYVSQLENSEDLIFYLKSLTQQDKGKFVLQKYIEGIEISSEIYFNGKDFYFLNWTMEDKKFMNDNLGVNTGCSQDVLKFFTPDKKLFKEGLGKIVGFLRQINFIGQIDFNSIISDDKYYFLEITPRFGYNSIFTTIELLGLDYYIESIYLLAGGEKIQEKRPSEYGCSVRISIPNYPFQETSLFGTPILFDEKDEEHIWLGGVFYQDGYYLTSGGYGCVAYITEKHNILLKGVERVYKIVEKVKTIDIQYRTDLGKRQSKQIPELVKSGWI